MKRLLILPLLVWAAAASAQSVDTGTLVYLNGRSPRTLDPVAADDVVSYIVSANLYESLITFQSTQDVDHFQPLLAAQVPSRENGLLSQDGLTYTFPIRKDVRFHDGSALTPEDVRYSLLRFMLTQTEEGRSTLLLRPLLGIYDLRDLSGKLLADASVADVAAAVVRVVGDSVVLRLKKPDSSFLKVLASLPIITSKSWTVAHGGWDGTTSAWKPAGGLAHPKYLEDHENGTGPFRLESLTRDDLVLARFDAYWRAPAALNKVIMRPVPDGAMRLLMLESGDADAAYLESSYRPFVRGAQGITTVSDLPSADMGNIFFFTFKTAGADNELLGSGRLDGKGLPADFFSDADARRALAYAFDYDKFFKQAIGGSDAKKDQGLFPSALIDIPRKEPFQHDPAKAAALLQKADKGEVWKNGFILPIAYLRSDATRQAAAEIMKEGLEALNPKFKVRLHPMAAGEFYAGMRASELPLYVSSYYSDYPDAQALAFGLLHSRGAFPRLQGYSDPEADALIEKAPTLTDPKERHELYLRLADLAGKDVPQIYTFSPLPFRVCRDAVKGCDSTDNTNNLGFNNFPYFYAYSKKPE